MTNTHYCFRLSQYDAVHSLCLLRLSWYVPTIFKWRKAVLTVARTYKRPLMPRALYLQACPVLRLYLSAMSNATYNAAFVREVVQGVIVENCTRYASLAVLIYDTSKPLLICTNLPDSEIVLSFDKEVRVQVIQLWSTTCLLWRPRRITSGYSAFTSLKQLGPKP